MIIDITAIVTPLPYPADPLRANAHDVALKLLQSADTEFRVALAIQTTYLGHRLEPAHVHRLLDEPRTNLIARFHAIVCAQLATEADLLPVYSALAVKAHEADLKYHRLRERVTARPADLHEFNQLTGQLGQLARQLMVCNADSLDLWALFEAVAVDVKDCDFRHLL